jgi:hypothetical protein
VRKIFRFGSNGSADVGEDFLNAVYDNFLSEEAGGVYPPVGQGLFLLMAE